MRSLRAYSDVEGLEAWDSKVSFRLEPLKAHMDKGRVYLPGVEELREDLRAYVLLPASSRVLVCGSGPLLATCEALESISPSPEWATQVLVLTCEPLSSFPDAAVVDFLNMLHNHCKCSNAEWWISWFYLMDAFRVTSLYEVAKRIINEALKQYKNDAGPNVWPWLAVKSLRPTRAELSKSCVEQLSQSTSVARARMQGEDRVLFTKLFTLDELFNLVEQGLSRDMTCTIQVDNEPCPSTHQIPVCTGMVIRDMKCRVAELTGIPVSRQIWSRKGNAKQLSDLDPVHEVSRYGGCQYTYFDVRGQTHPESKFTRIAFYPATKTPLSSRMILNVSEEYQLVCDAGLLQMQSAFLRNVNSDDLESPTQEIVVPLAFAERFDQEVVVDFFRRLHNQTITDQSAWKISWVHLVHFLQIEGLMQIAGKVAWDAIGSKLLESTDLFWDCIEASRTFHSSKPDGLPSTEKPADVASIILRERSLLAAKLVCGKAYRKKFIQEFGDSTAQVLFDILFKS